MNLFRTLTIVGIICLCIPFGFSQEKPTARDQFLYAIVELHQIDGSEDFLVDFKSLKVIDQKLRVPTKSETINTDINNYLRFQITDDGLNTLDEVIINDPFNVEYEYVDEQGKLQRTVAFQKDRSILIRRPISNQATSLVVKLSTNKRSSQSFSYKFR